MSLFKKRKRVEESNESTFESGETRTNYFYAITFGIILICALISRFWNNNEKETNIPKETPIEMEETAFLKSLESNNFQLNFIIFIDNDITEFEIIRETLNKELVSKIYRDNNKNYYINGNQVYEIDNDNKLLPINMEIYDDINKPFLNIEVINKLIQNKTYELDLKEEEYNIKRYKIEISRVINLYNEFNNKEIQKSVSGEAILDINYRNSELKGIKLDLTSLYKNLNYDYEKVIYYYEFSNFNSVDIKSFITLPAE